jgi:type II secretory pathway pseudopilin PulG
MSLVEILIVLVVVALLATMVISVASRIDTQAKEKGAESMFVLLDSALQEYRQFMDRFPEQAEANYANAVIHSEYLYSELQSIPGVQKILAKIDDSSIENKYGTAQTPPRSTIRGERHWITDTSSATIFRAWYRPDPTRPSAQRTT